MGECRILVRTSEPFHDRPEAGRQLAEALADLADESPVILGVPRGGVVVAREIARALDGELDVVLARKLRAPGNPELAIGAVAETGERYVNPIARGLADDAYLDAETARRRADIEERAARYRAQRKKVPLADRVAVITDDGVATGATVQVAIWAVRAEAPARLLVALPVGSEDVVESLAEDADDLVCLNCPPYFRAVGQFYERFEQTGDEEVVAILAQAGGAEEV